MKMSKRQKGLTLLELMIALSLGVIVVAMLLKMFDGSHVNYRTVSALNELEENASFASSFIRDEVKKAGYKPIPYVLEGSGWHDLVLDSPNFIFGAGGITKYPDDSKPGAFPFSAYPRKAKASERDEVTVYFGGDDETDVFTCNGVRVGLREIGYSRIYTAPSENGEQELDLMCEGGLLGEAPGAVTILEGGVGEMQIRYLVDLQRDADNACVPDGVKGPDTYTVTRADGTTEVVAVRGTAAAYLPSELIYEDVCNEGGNLLNKIRAVVFELDLISTKQNVSSGGVSADRNDAGDNQGRIGRQVSFTVNMENALQ